MEENFSRTLVWKGDEFMKKWINSMMSKKYVLNALMLIGCVTASIARDGFCFFIYHQPKFPDALKDVE